VFGTVLGGVLVPSTATALPLFLLFSKLGLANTYWGVLLPAMVSPFGLYLCRSTPRPPSTTPAGVRPAGRRRRAADLPHPGAAQHGAGAGHRVPVPAGGHLEQLPAAADHAGRRQAVPDHAGLNAWRSQVDRSPQFYELTIGGLLVSVIPLAIAMIFLQRYWRAA